MIRKAFLLIFGGLILFLLLPALLVVAQPVQTQASIPADATITSADLALYVITPSTSPTATANIHRITKSWTEATVTYNIINDQFDPAVSASFHPIASGWYTSSITALVQDWVDGVYPNYGIALEQGHAIYTVYASSENSISLRPKLKICYTAPGASNTCLTIQRPGAAQDGVADSFICDCLATEPVGGSDPQLFSGYFFGNHRQAQIRFNIPVINPSVNIVKYTNGKTASNPNGTDVPLIKPGDPVTWTYRITNTGNVTFTAQEMTVTDDQPGIVPVFDAIITGTSATSFKPGDVWQFKASGTAANLQTPPAGMKTVSGACTHGGTQIARTAYVNQGTVSVPNAAPKTVKSSYCNPIMIYLPLSFEH